MFHSFRHTFRTELRNHAVISERVDLLCGWKGDKGLNAHYGTISMKELYKTLSENIVYDGLDLSFLYVKEIFLGKLQMEGLKKFALLIETVF